jgi:autotransporter-associated beta strand protein
LFTVTASGALGSGPVTIQGGHLQTWTTAYIPTGVPSAFIFSGGTTTHANNFILSGNANLSVSSPDAATTTADRVTLSGTVNLGANTLYVRGRGTGIISGVISGTGGITKIDTPGTWVLSGANTYSGATTVSAGALQVGSSGAGQTGTGAVTVQTGSVILGTGTVRGTSFTADSGSTLHAGDSTAAGSFGTLNFTPASSGGTLSLQGSIVLGIGTANNHGSIDGSFGGNDVGTAGYIAYVNDVSRSLGLGAGSHDLLSFNNPSGGGSTSLNFLTTTGSLQVLGSGFTAAKGQIFNLLDWGTLVTANFTGFNLGSNYRDGSGDTGSPFDLPDISSSGLVWDVSQFTTSGVIVVVPEPSRVLLMLGGFAALLLRRRRAKV